MMDGLIAETAHLPYVGFAVGDGGETRIVVMGVSMSPDEAIAFAQLIFRRASEAHAETWTVAGNA